MSATIARPTSIESAHFYDSITSAPLYECSRADGSGMRPFTLADAKKMDPLPVPSVTTILSCRARPQLEAYKVEMGVLAAMTTPRQPQESLDAFIERVLHTERHQDQESDKAKKRGTQIHDAMEKLFRGEGGEVDPEIKPWVMPAFTAVYGFGPFIGLEKCFTKGGYGGRCDLVQMVDFDFSPKRMLWDWKTCKTIPKTPYDENLLQIAAYCHALDAERGANCYISTTNCGEFKIVEHTNIVDTFYKGFQPLFEHWQWSNNYFVK